MSYLYGDSTVSELEVNFIEFLREAVDFSVHVLAAEQRISEGRAHTHALESVTTAELERLKELPPLVAKALEGIAHGPLDSATTRCVAAISSSAFDLACAEAASLRTALDAAVAKRDQLAAAEREGCFKALEKLLLQHDLPDTTEGFHVVLVQGERYVCRTNLKTGSGLDAVLDLKVPAEHLFGKALRVERLAERLDVRVPEIAGWLHKEMKQRTQHLDKFFVSELSVGAGLGKLKLRAAADGTGQGFDFLFSKQSPQVRMSRADQQKDEPPHLVEEADAQKLVALFDKLSAAVLGLREQRSKLLEAKFEGEPFRTHENPAVLVERLITDITPVVQEIARRSQSPNELVLRRPLGSDRREEIFLSKAELRQKLEPLLESNRALFEPIFFTPPRQRVKSQTPPPSVVEPVDSTGA